MRGDSGERPGGRSQNKLALAAPVIVNIVAFHLFLAPAGLGLAAAVLAAEVYLAWTHREAFVPMLRSAA